tara:strand:+ start:602 stop:796 length:195 start_codon:yes stop_codon:yes gene_type:complete
MRRREMGRLKSYMHDWLEASGFDLGYGWDNYPDMNDIEKIEESNIPAWEYYGFKTEKEYYKEKM